MRWFLRSAIAQQRVRQRRGGARRWRCAAAALCLLVILLAGCSPAPELAASPATPGQPELVVVPTPSPVPTSVPTAIPTATSIPTALPGTTAPPTLTASPLSTPSALPTPRPTPTLPTLDADERARRLDEVWQAVADHYLYPDFRGVDWPVVRDRYRSRALQAPTSQEFYATLSQMVRELRDEHSRYYSPQEAWEEKAITQGTDAYVGIGVVIGDEPPGGVIRFVFKDSPAEQAGLRRRDRIVGVEGHPFVLAQGALRGPEGSSVRIEVRSPGEAPREVVVQRLGITAKMVPEARRIGGGDVGYLFVPSFFSEDMGDLVTHALHDLVEKAPLEGLILDLRGNGGGWRPVLEEILASFVQGKVGEFFDQGKSYPLEVTPNDLFDHLRAVPLVVLVDGQTASYAEVLAAVLREAGRAELVGQVTPGNTESIYAYDFDDGSRLWVAQEGFRLLSGVDLEGSGVRPDELIDVNWALYPEAEDPHILRALDLLAMTPGM